MNGCSTFFAIIKAYTSMNVFVLPIGFKEGGWLFSPIVLIISCFFEALSAYKLAQAANKLRIYRYQDLVEHALGSTYKIVFQVIMAFAGLSFTFGQLSFFIRTLQSLAQLSAGEELEIWIFGGVTLAILGPLAWIRTLETFRLGFIVAVVIIFIMIVIVSTFDFIIINDNEGNAGPGW